MTGVTYLADSLCAFKTTSFWTTYFLYDGSEPIVEMNSSGRLTTTNVFAPDSNSYSSPIAIIVQVGEEIKEIAEIRVREKFAHLLFKKGEGQLLGDPIGGYDIRKITLDTRDPRFEEVGRLNAKIRAEGNGEYFFLGWGIWQSPTSSQLRQANLCLLVITSMFEPAGEECGTRYDDGQACPLCGAGAPQLNDLRLDLRKAPKTAQISHTIAWTEWIVSQSFAERMVDAGLTGFELRPVRHKAKYEDDPMELEKVPTGRVLFEMADRAGFPWGTYGYYVWLNREPQRELLDKATKEWIEYAGRRDLRSRKPLPVWYQLHVTTSYVEFAPSTRVGMGLFDDDLEGRYRCPTGDTAGLNLLSSVSVKSESVDSSLDIQCSRQHIGCRRGLLRPHRLIFISPRFLRLIQEHRVKGARAEVVRLI